MPCLDPVYQMTIQSNLFEIMQFSCLIFVLLYSYLSVLLKHHFINIMLHLCRENWLRSAFSCKGRRNENYTIGGFVCFCMLFAWFICSFISLFAWLWYDLRGWLGVKSIPLSCYLFVFSSPSASLELREKLHCRMWGRTEVTERSLIDAII